MMDEKGSNGANKHPKRDVDDPVNAQVKNGENKQKRVDADKDVVPVMLPLLHGATLLTHMQPVEENNSERYRHVKGWN